MSNSEPRNQFFNAVRQLAESETHLIKVIQKTRKNFDETMSTTPNLRSNNNDGKKRSGRLSKVKPSEAIITAKREAAKNKSQKRPENFYIQDVYQAAIDSKKMIRGATGVVYDRSMAEQRCLWDEGYPECPERFTRVLQRCEELGLIDRCKFIEPRLAKINEILLKHTIKQIEILKDTEGSQDVDKLEQISSKYDAIYIHPSTYQLSLLAAGSTINLLESICRGEVQNGMAIIRPPGHHAMKSEYCGYCFFNNVAIASEKILADGLAKKILIVDWDVHHGQATQQMFYDDPRVVYFSIHRYENGKFWPNLRESDYHYIGSGPGIGHNFNIPLNKTGMTNADYLAIFQQVLLPMAYEYQPDVVVISAGYDAALGCPEGEMVITPAFYAHLLSPLMGLAGGKVAVILEGGYCLESLSESAALTLRTLLGDPCPIISTLNPPCQSIQDTILNVIYAQKPYWSCYQYQTTYSIDSSSITNEDLKKHLPAVIFNGSEEKPDYYETRNCYPIQSETTLKDIHNRLTSLRLTTNLNKAPNRVCLVYDDIMLKHFNYSDNMHPETPKRISEIFAKHKEYELLDRCHILQGRVATEEELLLVHAKEHINKMRKTSESKPSELTKQAKDLESVYLHRETFDSACTAAGSLLRVVDSVLNGESQSGVAIVRPPGHHAGEEEACGFCIFNNISVAAKYATKFHGLERVLIVDWDIHHGNGTQSILEDDPKILYISIHRYDNGSFFPQSKAANYDVVGTGAGVGFNVNIPWNRRKMGDAEYIAAFQQVVMPIAYQFNPELVLISAGFDACVGDPLGHYTVSPEAYGLFTHWLSPLANGRVILALEGGYNINSISYAMTMCTKALLNDPIPVVSTAVPCSSAISTIKNVLKVQRNYWCNLVFQVMLPKENVLPEATLPILTDDGALSPGAEHKIAFERLETEKCGKMEDLEVKMKNLQVANKATNECKNTDKASQPGSSGTVDGSGGSGEQAAGGSEKQTLQEYLGENFQALVDGEMFAVIPIRDCPHLELIQEVPEQGIDIKSPCVECASVEENWVCLICYTIHCARSVNEHAMFHGVALEHPLTLSFTDLSVWCYGCNAYVDNPRLYPARNKIHQEKFNQELPWTYNEFELGA